MKVNGESILPTILQSHCNTLSHNVITSNIPEDNIVKQAPNYFEFSLLYRQKAAGEDSDMHTHTYVPTNTLNH